MCGNNIALMPMHPERENTIECLKRYWPKNSTPIRNLPIPENIRPAEEKLPPNMIEVKLPTWAFYFGIEGKLLAPSWAISTGETLQWKRTDWLSVGFWFLQNIAERSHERHYGAIHSYCNRLEKWDKRLWQYAWANRIGLFLRAWAARENNANELELLGALPEPEIIMTHDVDAIKKTMAIRCKQTIFYLFNAGRLCFQGRVRRGFSKLRSAVYFFLSREDYWCFDLITDLEKKAGIRSWFIFFAGDLKKNRSWKKILFDPNYEIFDPRIKKQLQMLLKGGWSIGLHPSFCTWRDISCMKQEKKKLEKALTSTISICRQHWLRFSWQDTWKTQQKAGLKLDTTLGFNDFPGFRNGAAIRFRPWNFSTGSPMNIEVLPMVFMDSHFYDYFDMTDSERNSAIENLTKEIKFVRGQATILWHQHVMRNDYGWGDGFRHTLKQIS